MVNAKVSSGQVAMRQTSGMRVATTASNKPAKMARNEAVPSNSLKSIWKEVCRKQKPLMVAMFIVGIMSVILFVISLSTLKPQNTVVIVGYGDVYGEIAGISGGYRRESWAAMLAFPILAVIYGIVHNLLVLRIYRKYGRDVAMVVAVMTMALIVGTFVTMIRLIGEW